LQSAGAVEICVYFGARRSDCAGISANFCKGSPPTGGDRLLVADGRPRTIGRDLATLGNRT
jgi:hypothetical protein